MILVDAKNIPSSLFRRPVQKSPSEKPRYTLRKKRKGGGATSNKMSNLRFFTVKNERNPQEAGTMPQTPQTSENHASAIWRKHSDNISSARCREWTICRMLATTDSKEWTLAISEDDRQRMRAAWVILQVINQYSPSEALTIRRNYGHRRIIEAGAKWKRLEFEVSMLIDHIKSDLSTNAMCAEIENAHGDPEWRRRVWGVYKNIDKLCTDYGADQWVQDWARESRELFKRNGVEL